MDMSNQEITLCASNAYNKKFYLNNNFNGLPEAIKEELQIMCVLFTEDVGGILTNAAFAQVFGDWTSVFLTGALCCFAFATI